MPLNRTKQSIFIYKKKLQYIIWFLKMPSNFFSHHYFWNHSIQSGIVFIKFLLFFFFFFFLIIIDCLLQRNITTFSRNHCNISFGENITCGALINSWKQHFTNLQLYGHLPPISQTIQICIYQPLRKSRM